MSTHITGFKPADAKWEKMAAAYKACVSADIPVPQEIAKFFGYSSPDPAGVEVSESELEKCGAVRDFNDDSRSGFEVDVRKLPTDVTILRFYNSY